MQKHRVKPHTSKWKVFPPGHRGDLATNIGLAQFKKGRCGFADTDGGYYLLSPVSTDGWEPSDEYTPEDGSTSRVMWRWAPLASTFALAEVILPHHGMEAQLGTEEHRDLLQLEEFLRSVRWHTPAQIPAEISAGRGGPIPAEWSSDELSLARSMWGGGVHVRDVVDYLAGLRS